MVLQLIEMQSAKLVRGQTHINTELFTTLAVSNKLSTKYRDQRDWKKTKTNIKGLRGISIMMNFIFL